MLVGFPTKLMNYPVLSRGQNSVGPMWVAHMDPTFTPTGPHMQ